MISSAENPEKMLNQLILDMSNQLARAKQQVAAAIADEKRLRDQADAEYRQAEDWEKRAILAVQEQRDDLAKQCLLRQQEHFERGTQLEQQWQSQRAETERLKASLRDFNDKIEEARRKKNLLLARQRRAEAQKRIAETMSSLSEKSAFEAFARMEEKIEQNERTVRANVEIDEEFSGDRLANDVKLLERAAGGAGAEDRLLALKQKMGMLPAGAPVASRQLGAGQPAAVGDGARATAALPAGNGGAQPQGAGGEPAKHPTEEELLAEFEDLTRQKPQR
jgi:phage shock protein A